MKRSKLEKQLVLHDAAGVPRVMLMMLKRRGGQTTPCCVLSSTSFTEDGPGKTLAIVLTPSHAARVAAWLADWAILYKKGSR